MSNKARVSPKDGSGKNRIAYNLCWLYMEQNIQSENEPSKLSHPAASLLSLMNEAKRIEKSDSQKAWEFLKDILLDQSTSKTAPRHAALSRAILEDMKALEEHCSIRIATQDMSEVK